MARPQVDPPSSAADVPVVGVGASAGGLEACERFFSRIPVDTGAAFVVVQHLDPTHPSLLTDLLGRFTHMPTAEIVDGMTVAPGRIHVTPPGRTPVLEADALRLRPQASPRGLSGPIDAFFRSLAAARGDRAVAVVLSGAGSDGTAGLRAIKEAGGFTLVQSPESARFEGMPMSAIAGDAVDIVGRPEELASHVVALARPTTPAGATDPGDLREVLRLVRDSTGHDFFGYKVSTVARRVERRLVVTGAADLDAYARVLRDAPLEVEALFRELLIGVTSFFRDPAAFDALANLVLDAWVAQGAPRGRSLRVWVPACSTGEEAYSLAILIHERLARAGRRVDVNIFATDIDPVALEYARAGRYPASIAEDVSPERLQAYFTFDGERYQVNRPIRDMLVFAVQSVTKDPPLSKLDLVSCRNLLIYLDAALQQRLLPLLHFALNPDGFLFLGSSETLGASQRLYRTIDSKWKIFQRQPIVGEPLALRLPVEHMAPREGRGATPPAGRGPTLREMTERALLEWHTPTAIVVNAKGEMLYVHGRTGQFLEQTTGEASTNVLRVARDGLRAPLAHALTQATRSRSSVVLADVSIRVNDERLPVRVTVTPIAAPASAPGLLLVTLSPLAPAAALAGHGPARADAESTRALELEEELRSTRDFLQTTVEELETTNEELQSANEELQSVNEELQTSKEELQSINEELITVNTELQARVNELVEAHADIRNLLDNVSIGILFLDTDLRIRRFTASVRPIIDLIPTDVGRPIARFSHNLRHDGLADDARAVLESLAPKELELESLAGDWYLVRVAPYHGVENAVAGVVLTFTDVTPLKRAHAKLEFLFDNVPVGLGVADRDGVMLKYNREMLRISDLTPEEIAAGAHLRREYLREDRTPRPRAELAVARAASGAPFVRDVVSGVPRRDGGVTWAATSVLASPFSDWPLLVATSDVSERRLAREALAVSEERFKKAFHGSPIMMTLTELASGRILDANPTFCDTLGLARDEVLGGTFVGLGVISPEVRREGASVLARDGAATARELVLTPRRGEPIHVLATAFVIDVRGEKHVVSALQDVSAQRRASEALRASEAKYMDLFDHAPDMYLTIDAATAAIVDCNATTTSALGFSRDQLVGRPVVELWPAETDVWSVFLACGEVMGERTRLARKDGAKLDADVRITAVRDGAGNIVQGRAVLRDVTDRVRAEEAIRADLRRERDTVLRELAHRTKNNMFVIRSMLELHAASSESDEVRRIVDDVNDKITAMALVHQRLYQSRHLSRIDLGDYLRELAAALRQSHVGQRSRVQVTVEAASLSVLIDTAIPCGLIATELVSNAFKHGLKDRDSGTIAIRVERASARSIHLQVQDDGRGVADARVLTAGGTLGLQMTRMLVEHQLRGDISFDTTAGGLRCDVRFDDALYGERV